MNTNEHNCTKCGFAGNCPLEGCKKWSAEGKHVEEVEEAKRKYTELLALAYSELLKRNPMYSILINTLDVTDFATAVFGVGYYAGRVAADVPEVFKK